MELQAIEKTLYQILPERIVREMVEQYNGDPTESADDVRVTKLMVRAGEFMGIPVLDHVIIGKGRYTSMMEKGII